MSAAVIGRRPVALDHHRFLKSVALGLEADGKPKIVVNLTELGKDGHSLSASLLTLARIVK